MSQEGFDLSDNSIRIGSGKNLPITARILVVGSQRVNKYSKNLRSDQK